jgi:hypothetical protein
VATQPHFPLYSRSREPSETTRRVEALLSRYPDISEPELAILIEAVPRLPILDAALMASDDRLSKQVEAFHRDHGHELKHPWGGLLAFLAVPAILTVGLLLWFLNSLHLF